MNLPTIPDTKIKGNLGETLTTLLLSSFAIPISITPTDIGIDIQGELIKESHPIGRTFRIQVKFWKKKPYPSKETKNYWTLLSEPIFLFWIKGTDIKPSFDDTINAERFYKKYPSKLDSTQDIDFKEFDENKFIEEINKYWDDFEQRTNNNGNQSITPKKNINSIKKINKSSNSNSLEKLFEDVNQKIKTNKAINDFSKIRLFLFSAAQLYKNRLPSEILNNHEINLLYSFKNKVKLTKFEVILIARTLLSDIYNHKPGWYWINFNNNIEDFISSIGYLIQNDLSEDVIIGCLNLIDLIWTENTVYIFKQPKQLYNDSIKFKELNILQNHPCLDTQNACKEYLTDQSEDVRKKATEVYTSIITKVSPHSAITLLTDDKNYDKYKISQEFYPQLDEQELRKLESHQDDNIRFNAINELIKKNLTTVPELKSIINDKHWNTKFIIIRELIKKGEQFSIDQIKEKLRWDGKNISELFSRRLYELDEKELIKQEYKKISSEELSKILKWDFDSPEIYEVLNKRKKEFIETVRIDLWDDFNNKRNELLTKEANEKKIPFSTLDQNWKDYDKTLKKIFTKVALKILNEEGNTQDIKIALKYIDGSDYEITSICKEIILKYSSKINVPLLINIAQKDKSFKYALKVLETSFDKTKTINQLLNLNDNTCTITAIAYSYKNKIVIDSETLINFLSSEDEFIRKYTVTYLCKFNTEVLNRKILKEYSNRENYYYDVISIFDKLLFSPLFLKRIYKNKLQQELLNKVY